MGGNGGNGGNGGDGGLLGNGGSAVVFDQEMVTAPGL
jgi:hypothetical protein